jgi:hypothetical protein
MSPTYLDRVVIPIEDIDTRMGRGGLFNNASLPAKNRSIGTVNDFRQGVKRQPQACWGYTCSREIVYSQNITLVLRLPLSWLRISTESCAHEISVIQHGLVYLAGPFLTQTRIRMSSTAS